MGKCIFPIVLGRAVRDFCRTNVSFDILRSAFGEARSCGWSDGGCWMLAAAIQQRWGGELYALSRTGSDAQHVVVHIDQVFIDQDGPAFGKAFIRRFQRPGRFSSRVAFRLVPFCATMSGDIPKPARVEGGDYCRICNHIPLTCSPVLKRVAS